MEFWVEGAEQNHGYKALDFEKRAKVFEEEVQGIEMIYLCIREAGRNAICWRWPNFGQKTRHFVVFCCFGESRAYTPTITYKGWYFGRQRERTYNYYMIVFWTRQEQCSEKDWGESEVRLHSWDFKGRHDIVHATCILEQSNKSADLRSLSRKRTKYKLWM
jgi:hypothetical protein